MAVQGDFECLLDGDGFKHFDIQIQRRSERHGRTPGFKDWKLRSDLMMKTETMSTPRRRVQDATSVWSDGRRSLILNKIDATRCKSGASRQVGFCWSSETLGQWSSQWASLVDSFLSQWSLPCEIRWHRLGTALRNLHDSIECWRNGEFCDGSIGSRTVKGKQRYARLSGYKNKFETKMSVSRRKKNWANVATKPIVACVLQRCSNRKIGILQAMDATLHDKMMVASRWWIWRRVCRLGVYIHRLGMNTRWPRYVHRDPRGTQKQKQKQKHTWTSRRMHKLSETKERWTSLRHFSRWMDHDSKSESKSKARCKARATSNENFVNLLTPSRGLAKNFKKPNDARGWQRTDTLSEPCCACTRAVVVGSTLWTGQDAVDQAWKRWAVRTGVSWQTCLLSFVSNVTSAFDSRIMHRKGATCARGGLLKFIHVVNNDTIMHAAHTCTVSCLQYTVLIKCSICSCPHWMRTLREWLKKQDPQKMTRSHVNSSKFSRFFFFSKKKKHLWILRVLSSLAQFVIFFWIICLKKSTNCKICFFFDIFHFWKIVDPSGMGFPWSQNFFWKITNKARKHRRFKCVLFDVFMFLIFWFLYQKISNISKNSKNQQLNVFFFQKTCEIVFNFQVFFSNNWIPRAWGSHHFFLTATLTHTEPKPHTHTQPTPHPDPTHTHNPTWGVLPFL